MTANTAFSSPPSKRSRGHHGYLARLGSVAQFLNLVDQMAESTDHCSICTFLLTEHGMFDDESSGHRPPLCQLNLCNHAFHFNCLYEMVKGNDHMQCPQCKMVYGIKMGTQPKSIKMSHRLTSYSLPGHADVGTIEITYSAPHHGNHIQGPEHPKPGRPFRFAAFPRVAYLPNNVKGQKVLRLLRRAFDQRLIFTVGRSTTSGRDDVVTWNDIHHKTQAYPGEHGYPDDRYLDSVISDIAQHGIVE